MSELTIKMSKANLPNAAVVVNGSEVKFKKGSDGLYESKFPLNENDNTCTLEVFTFSEYGGKLWWLYSLLFFVVSCFGIFDVPYGKTIALRYKTKLTLCENTQVMLRFNPMLEGKKAVELDTNVVSEEETNGYFLDETLRKRRKIMKIIKALTWVAIIVGGIVGTVCWLILR